MIRFPLLYSSDFPGIKSSLYFHFLCFFESKSSLPYPLRTQEISILLFAHLMNSGNSLESSVWDLSGPAVPLSPGNPRGLSLY